MRLRSRPTSRNNGSHNTTKQRVNLSNTFLTTNIESRSRINQKRYHHHDLSSRMLKKMSKNSRMLPSMTLLVLQDCLKPMTTESLVP